MLVNIIVHAIAALATIIINVLLCKYWYGIGYLKGSTEFFNIWAENSLKNNS